MVRIFCPLLALTMTEASLRLFFSSPVQVEDVCKTFFIISIHDICCCHTGTLVHTHIQCPVKTEGEATFAIIEMMGRYAEVGQDRVYLFDVVITQEVVQIAGSYCARR